MGSTRIRLQSQTYKKRCFDPISSAAFELAFCTSIKPELKKWACFASLFFLQIASKFYISLEGPKNTKSPSLIEFYPVNKRKTSCEILSYIVAFSEYMNFNRRRLCFRKKMMSFGGRHVFKKEIKILAVCHAWFFFFAFFY